MMYTMQVINWEMQGYAVLQLGEIEPQHKLRVQIAGSRLCLTGLLVLVSLVFL